MKIYIIAIAVLLVSCSEDIILENLPIPANQLIVEGSIETDAPPIVFLSKNFPYYGDYNLNDIASFFVHNAAMSVKSQTGQEVQLQEFCIKEFLPLLSSDQKVNIYRLFGLNYNRDSVEKYGDSLALFPNICFYSIPDIFTFYTSGTGSMLGKENTSYSLDIKLDTFHLTSTTRIPSLIRPNGLSFKPHPNPQNDSLVTVYISLSVPDTFGNFVRYWTKRNNNSFFLPRSRSVWDDKLWVGSNVNLPIERGQARRDSIREAYSYFWRGDKVQIKWTNIDKQTYDFWSSLESDRGDSPFATPLKIKSNIKGGGLGVWAGYAVNNLFIDIPKK